MIAAIRGLLASRKFVLLLVGCIVAIGGHLGLKLDPEIIGMVLGLIAVGVGSIAYEDGQAKRATVIDGGSIDGPVVVSGHDPGQSLASEGPVARKEPIVIVSGNDRMDLPSERQAKARAIVALATKADVVDAMVKVDEGNP